MFRHLPLRLERAGCLRKPTSGRIIKWLESKLHFKAEVVAFLFDLQACTESSYHRIQRVSQFRCRRDACLRAASEKGLAFGLVCDLGLIPPRVLQNSDHFFESDVPHSGAAPSVQTAAATHRSLCSPRALRGRGLQASSFRRAEPWLDLKAIGPSPPHAKCRRACCVYPGQGPVIGLPAGGDTLRFRELQLCWIGHVPGAARRSSAGQAPPFPGKGNVNTVEIDCISRGGLLPPRPDSVLQTAMAAR